VCNHTYGDTGWLGLAQVGSSDGHISWGVAKMNDTYFNDVGYPYPQKLHVMCQELGDTFGLGHTSEDGTSQNTCMDYYQNTSSTDWIGTMPYTHDLEQILIQHHWGEANFLPAPSPALLRVPGNDQLAEPWQWGTPFHWDPQGRADSFKLVIGTDHDGKEHSVVTHTIWVDPLWKGPVVLDKPSRRR